MLNIIYLMAVLFYLYFCTDEAEVKRVKEKFFKRWIILLVIFCFIYLFSIIFLINNGVSDFVLYLSLFVFLLLFYGIIEFYIFGLLRHNLRVIIFGILLLLAIFHFLFTNFWTNSSSLPRLLSVSLAFLSFYLAFWELTSINNLHKKFVNIVRIMVFLLLSYFILGSVLPYLPLSRFMEDFRIINTDYLTFLSVIMFFLTSGLKDSLHLQKKNT